MPSHFDRFRSRCLVFAGACAVCAPLAAAEPLDDIIETGAGSAVQARAAQAGIERIDEETRALAAEYRALRRQIDALAVYNARLERQTAEQTRRLEAIDRASGEATVLAREMVPLLARMIDSLERFVALDKPFRIEERRQRVAALRDSLERPDVSLAAVFGALMDAYRAELDYADGLGVYSAEIETTTARRTVDVLQVGRVALFAQSEDGSASWMWSEDTRAWEMLEDGDSALAIARGIRIARERASQGLLRLPLPAPSEASP